MIKLKVKGLLQNTLPSKIVSVKLRIAGFSTYHFILKKVDGKPMPSIENSQQNDTAYITYRFREMKPKAQKNITWHLLLKYKDIQIPDLRITEIPDKESLRVRSIFNQWFSRRLNHAALRLLEKSKDILEFETEVLNFLSRNFKKINKLSEFPVNFFESKYGGAEDFVFGFRVLNAIVGIPTRGVYGFKMENSNFVEWVWAQVGYGGKWIDIDPFLGGIIEKPNAYVPIMIYRNPLMPPLYSVDYKVVRRILKRGLDFKILQFKIESINWKFEFL